ncbi:two-component system sensor histidine kinase NtrB [Heliophilum fasciatum]|uniref:histidine kinase n=1 Tax=Heliophilum fasciatum TaxID=35700 RepID=A0A4V2SWN8_9FIRM|nr:ATP-binding protein [Heliophilum fasciatum]MCW2278592.1 PAS domain S-box-containing protein [Heliophilum fasciatum]TCP62706.1 PAS domain S-box-containing protein [Heliophilum fasciatum]
MSIPVGYLPFSHMKNDVFYTVFRTSPQLMTIHQFPDGDFLDVNDSFTRFTGYTRAEVIGQSPKNKKFNGPFTHIDNFLTLLLNRTNPNGYMASYFTKDHQERVGLFSGVLVSLQGQACVVLQVQDITEQQQLLHDVKRNERLHLISHVAAGIGHEIRNPLTTVRGFLQLMHKKETDPTRTDQFALMIEELDHANNIITDFLSLTRSQPSSLSCYGLHAFITALLPAFHAMAEARSQTVVLTLDSSEPIVHIDQMEFRRLVRHLVQNGLEAMEPGQTLTIETASTPHAVLLKIRDQGCGIPAGNLAKIYHPFFTTKDHALGLGLAICEQIAAHHHATLQVDTGPQGTTFTVCLPH